MPGAAPAWSHFGDRVITPSLQSGTLRCRQVQGQAPITPPGGGSLGVKPGALTSAPQQPPLVTRCCLPSEGT